MRALLGRIVHRVVQRVMPEVPPLSPVEIDDLALIREAHAEWQAAKTYFENVSDPALVDHAIALLTAAERRYAYLIQRARQHGLTDGDLERALGVRLPEGAWRPTGTGEPD